MQPRRLFCPVRAECWFQVTKRGYSSCARVFPVELSDVSDEAGVAPPFEPKLELEPGVDGSELLLLPAEPVLLFSSLDIAAGRAGSSDSVSTSVTCSSSVVAFSCGAPACAGASFFSPPCW
jgi:hypothetical protein